MPQTKSARTSAEAFQTPLPAVSATRQKTAACRCRLHMLPNARNPRSRRACCTLYPPQNVRLLPHFHQPPAEFPPSKSHRNQFRWTSSDTPASKHRHARRKRTPRMLLPCSPSAYRPEHRTPQQQGREEKSLRPAYLASSPLNRAPNQPDLRLKFQPLQYPPRFPQLRFLSYPRFLR